MLISEAQVEVLKNFVKFDAEDVRQLRLLAEPIQPFLVKVVARFYKRLSAHPLTREVLERSSVLPDSLRASLTRWMEKLFEGRYDQAYFERRMAIGLTHVRVDMPEHLMILAMSVLRADLVEHVQTLGLANTSAKVAAVHKLLDLELTVMILSVHEELTRRIREAEHEAVRSRLEETEHLANVGQLAATLAHEIKNPLAGISGAIQVIGNSLPADSPQKEVIGEVISEIDRLDATARDLLIYARPKPPLRKKLHVGPLLHQVLMQLRQQPSLHGLFIRCGGIECADQALIDEAQFKQLISNLLLNAAHACEKGGDVTFRLSAAQNMVRIKVIDTGKGIPADALEHIFEPFFTTKAKGTGLGLSICKWIVESHSGRIQLSSQEGRGTTVTIELPKES